MWRVTLKGLAAHKLRFALTGIAVLLGVAFVSGTFVFTATLQRTFDDLFTNIYRGTDAQVRARQVIKSEFGFQGGTRPRVPASLERVVRQAPGVAAAQGNVQLDYAQLVTPVGKVVGHPGQGAPSLGFGWNPVARLNQFHLVEGRPPGADDEIVIDKGTAGKGRFRVGGRVTVLTSKPPAPYTIVGIARFGAADNLAGASVVLFTLPRAQHIADAVGQYDAISVAARPGVSQALVAGQVRDALAGHGAANVEVVTGKRLTQEGQSAVRKGLGFFNTALFIFGLVALAVGAFIIYNTFSIVVAQRTREMALLRAIGASRRQVLGSVLGEALAVGVVASVAGVGGGVGLAVGLRSLMRALGIDLPATGAVVGPNAVVVGLLVGVGVTFVSAIVPARQAARVPPVAAMRDVAVERPLRRARRLTIGGAVTVLGVASLLGGLFARRSLPLVGLGAGLIFVGAFVLGPLYARAASFVIGLPISRVSGVTGTLARENAGRNPRRTAVTASALMIGVALVGFITVFSASAKASVKAAIDDQIKSDYVVNSGGSFGGTGLSPQLGEQIAALPQIAASTPVRVGRFAVDGKQEFLAAVDPRQAQRVFDFRAVAGRLSDLTPDGIVVSKKTADAHHWTIGTPVPVTFVKTGATTMRVEMIYDVKTLVIPGSFVISLRSYEQRFAGQLDVLVYAKLKPGVSAEQGRNAIEPLLARYPTAKLQDNAQYKADQERQIDQVVALIDALLVFAVVIAFIGIANTLALSIHERTHEIGLLRAVGMSRMQARLAIGWESVIIAMLGTLLGVVIGVLFGWVVVRALKGQGLNRFAAVPSDLAVLVVGAAVLAVAAALFPARRAARLDMLRAIATE